MGTPRAAAGTSVLVAGGLVLRYGDLAAVDGVSFHIDPGEIHVKRHIGLVPQDLAIYPELTARENLAYFGRLQGLRARELTRRIDEVLDLVGLADRAKEATKNYSGGMKRRLNIGIGLLHRPTLLILDEPTVGGPAVTQRHPRVRGGPCHRGYGPCSTPRTTWRRLSVSATASPSWTPAVSRPRARAAN